MKPSSFTSMPESPITAGSRLVQLPDAQKFQYPYVYFVFANWPCALFSNLPRTYTGAQVLFCLATAIDPRAPSDATSGEPCFRFLNQVFSKWQIFWISTSLTGIYRDMMSANALFCRFNFLFCQASALRCTKSSHELGSAVYFRRKMTPCNSALERNRASFCFIPETFLRVDCMPRCITDPLIHHGRHFGRTQHALCSIRLLLKNGLLRIGRLSNSNHSVTVRFVLVSRSVS